jgi:hypothetical protein
MTSDEAISIMNVIVHMLEQQYDTDRVEDAVEMAIKALDQEPSSSEKPNKWIPCSEKLPRASEIVLLSLPEHTMVDGEECYPCVICGHYIGGNSEEWGISDGTTVGYGLVAYKHCKPIAWMPLPQPYQSEIPTGEEGSEKND